jgi:hypothetical protein
LFLTQDIARLKFRDQVYLNKVYGIVSNGKNAFYELFCIESKFDLPFFTKKPPQ